MPGSRPQDQHPALQLDALHAAGCTKVCVEQASGAQRERPLEGVSVHREPEETTLA